MFKYLVARPSTIFTFLSGVFIALSVNALSDVVFITPAPVNAHALIAGTIVTFGAALGWFALGEKVARLNARATEASKALGGTEAEKMDAALLALKEDESARLYFVVAITAIMSFAWPLCGKL